MHLTKTERMILINQYEIRKALDPNDAVYYDEAIEILTNGYAVLYAELFTGISSDMPKSDGEFVLDVLQMFRVIEAYKQSHPNDSEVANHQWAHFHGFDGNNEGHCLQFTRFQIKVKKHWSEQWPYESQTDGFNSHTPMMGVYARMLKEWESFDKPYPLSRDQIMAILNAARG